jgi:hypothetical protein
VSGSKKTHFMPPLLSQPLEGIKKKKKGGPKGIKKKEAAGSGAKVTIMRMSRNKRKSITVITGLDTYPGKGRREGGRKRMGEAFWCVPRLRELAKLSPPKLHACLDPYFFFPILIL